MISHKFPIVIVESLLRQVVMHISMYPFITTILQALHFLKVGRILVFSSTDCINALTKQVPSTIPMPVANPVITVVRKNFSKVLACTGESKLLSLLILLIVDLFFLFITYFLLFFSFLKLQRITLLIFLQHFSIVLISELHTEKIQILQN